MKRLLYLLFTLIVLVSPVLPLPVYADTTSLTVAGEGSELGCSYVGAGNWHDVETNDGDTSYIMGVNPPYWNYHCWTYTSSPVVASINGVTLYFTVKRLNPSYNAPVTPYCYIGGIRYLGSQRDTTSDYATYSENTFGGVTNKNPATGQPWTKATLDTAQFGVAIYYNTGITARLTHIYLVEDYIAVSTPTVTTSSATSVAVASATLRGNIDDDGGATITNYGFVWGTSSNATAPSSVIAPADVATYTNNWTIGAGTYTEGAITHATGATLVANTIYYYRAAAYNSQGWDYGEEMSFETIGIPTILIQSATNVASTTARLNALVTNDNGQACIVSFTWLGNTENVTGTWVTGQYPYLDIGSLTVSTTYTFFATAYNDAGLASSSNSTFTTSSGVGNISNFTVIPTSTTISLAWVKGDGASNTWIKYSTSTYPLTVGSGTYLYAGTGNSYMLTGLTPGTNVYFSGWGLTAGVYSNNATFAMATLLATIPTDATLPTPDTPTSWGAEPSVVGIANVPFYALVNFFSDEYEIPNPTMWYGLSIFFSVGMGLFVYWRGNKNLLGAIFTTALGLFIGAILGLVYLWIGVFFCVIAAAMAWLAQRY